MKILHLPTSTGGNAWGLSTAERELGYDSTVLCVDHSYLEYDADIRIPLSKNYICAGLQMLKTALEVRGKYDVFHFNAGKTLMDYPRLLIDHLDIGFYKNKKCFMTYNGCDTRLKYGSIAKDKNCLCSDSRCGKGYCERRIVENNKKKRIEMINRAGMQIFCLNPDLLKFLPESTVFLPYTISNWKNIEEIPYKETKSNKPIRIVHAPTDRIKKGTDTIIKSVERINRRYPGKIELILIENMNHSHALQEYGKADLVIDQLRIGWYGAFAVEAIKMGKPVMAYINEDDLECIDKDMKRDVLDAFINANDRNMEEKLLYILQSPEILKDKRDAQLEYVWKYHDPVKIARRVVSFYER